VNTFVAKLNSTTLEVLQVKKLRPAIYLGGLLVHENGNLYAVQGNILTTFWNCDLDNATSITLPSRINSLNIIQTNGMVVSSDGLLVIRQWPYLIEDTLIVIYAMPPITIGFCFVFCVVFWLSLSSSRSSKPTSVLNTAYRLARGCVICALIYTAAFSLLTYKMAGSFDIFKFLFKTGATSGSELKLIDPLTMEVRAEIIIPERCAYARTALTTVQYAEEGTEEDIIVLVCEEFSRQFRWNSTERNLREVSNWSKRYRTRGTGSFAGTGPAIFNGTAFYTDNTFAIGVFGDSYSIFRQRLDGITEASNKNSSSFQSDRLSPQGEPGFMFWSVVISPFVGNVLVWDTMGRSVQSRSVEDLSVRWSVKAANADCISVAADKGHVYFTDLSDAPNSVFTWSPGVSPLSHFLFPDVTKYLIVADAESGRIIANITIMRGPGIKASLIVPGVNNDVFVGTASGISRIYV
jgi:hypothetical protein